jgi:hypothetical protein
MVNRNILVPSRVPSDCFTAAVSEGISRFRLNSDAPAATA